MYFIVLLSYLLLSGGGGSLVVVIMIACLSIERSSPNGGSEGCFRHHLLPCRAFLALLVGCGSLECTKTFTKQLSLSHLRGWAVHIFLLELRIGRLGLGEDLLASVIFIVCST